MRAFDCCCIKEIEKICREFESESEGSVNGRK
jgi:hypothetical protein